MAADLLSAIDRALDGQAQRGRDVHTYDCAVGIYVDMDCHCGLPDGVERRVAAERRILARHRPTECDCGTDWHTHRCRGCSQPWPCPEITDQADRLGIDTEEVRADG